MCRDKRIYCGTTALGAFVRANQLTVFNIGDCQAVLCSSGAAVPMSQAHQPGRPDERERITKAGGWITEERELYMGRLHRMDLSDPVVRDKAQQVNWTTIYRVCGELAVSRSIGDPDYKGFTPGEKVDAGFLWPENHAQVFEADLVIPMPEIRSKLLAPDDEFLLLASDGLWDVVSGAEAVNRTK
jgi:serine/threonine protein phosphatase PrpC